MSQDHTTIIRTDYEPRIIVQDSGEWCRLFYWFIDDVAPDLTGGQLKIQLHLCRIADRQTGRARTSRASIAARMKLSPGTVSDDLKRLLAYPARLLAEHPESFVVFPGHRYAGRGDPPDSAGRTRLRQAEENFGGPNTRAESLRAHHQPSKQEREIGNTKPNRGESRQDSSTRGVVGWSCWPELSLFGQRAFAAGDVAGVLRDLGAGEGLYGQLEGLADLTVAEVMARAAEVGADGKVLNKPYTLCYRLAASRGVKLERPEIGRARRMGDEWAELARVRVAKRGKA